MHNAPKPVDRILAAISSILLTALALFPPMRVRTEYLDSAEAGLAFRPVWAAREWTVGQVTYTADIHTGLAVAIGLGIISAGIVAYVAIDRS